LVLKSPAIANAQNVMGKLIKFVMLKVETRTHSIKRGVFRKAI